MKTDDDHLGSARSDHLALPDLVEECFELEVLRIFLIGRAGDNAEIGGSSFGQLVLV